MGEIKKYRVGDLVINFDRKRKPLSGRQRENMKGIYPYYGAACIFDYINDYIFDGEYILLGEDGTVINSDGTPVLQRISGKAWVNNHAHVLKNSEIIDFDYLYYVLKNANFSGAVTGAVQPKISQANMNAVEVNIHTDLRDQIKVASTLKSLDDKIELNNKINDNLSKQMNIMIDDYISKLDGYEIKLLSQVAELQNGYAFYKDGYDEEGAFVVDLGNVNINASFTNTNSDKFVNLDRYNNPKLEKFRVYKNDLIMVMTDRKSTMDLLGKTGKIFRDGKYLLNQRMYRIRAKEGMNVNYLYSVLNSSEVCNYLKSKALGSVQKYINTGVINDIKIKVPSPIKMEELSLIVDPMMTQIENNTFENEVLFKLRDTLLPKLMSGEIDVSDIKLDL